MALPKLKTNKRTWNEVAPNFFEASALPLWGPFSVGADLKLIPKIKGEVFLEIGCGSGRSIKYLTEHGAKVIYGIDFSSTQITEATRYNEDQIRKGKVKLIHSPMEKKQNLPPIDIVFSVYGLGWTLNPKKTLSNIYSYLKKGGLFIWSWDHGFFSDIEYKNGEYVVTHSYHNEELIHIKDWKCKGFDIELIYRKSSTWFQLLTQAGFEVIGYYEPEPKDLSRGHIDPSKYYSIKKAEKIPSTIIFVCRKP